MYNGFIKKHVAEKANSIILNLVIRYDEKDYNESKRHTFLNFVNLVQILSDDGEDEVVENNKLRIIVDTNLPDTDPVQREETIQCFLWDIYSDIEKIDLDIILKRRL